MILPADLIDGHDTGRWMDCQRMSAACSFGDPLWSWPYFNRFGGLRGKVGC